MTDQSGPPRNASPGHGKKAAGEKVVIQKYANRRLYNKATSTYITLDDLADMVREGVDFVVYDAKTGEDITRKVLTQIIFEEESRGQNLLPIQFLRQLIALLRRPDAGLPAELPGAVARQLHPPAGAAADPVHDDEPGRHRAPSRSRSARTWRCSTGR